MSLRTVAIVGRPNVGKSSLVNAIIGDNKLIVSDMENLYEAYLLQIK